MTTKLERLVVVAAMGLMLIACRSKSSDVPSLDRERQATPTAVVDEEPLDDEAKMMAFTECMRGEGIELVDAGVDPEGNVQRPTLAEGAEVSREKLSAAMAVCGKHLEGLTMGRERQDRAKELDERISLVTCLREKGYDVDDPTAETLDQWGIDFRVEFDWDDPKAKAAFDECNSAD
jgi:hypothetical protein